METVRGTPSGLDLTNRGREVRGGRSPPPSGLDIRAALVGTKLGQNRWLFGVAGFDFLGKRRDGRR